MNTTNQDLDTQTIAQVLVGEREEFRGLVERHFSATYAAALARTGNEVDAEDIVQEAFLRAFLKLDTLKKPERFGAWVVQIARNVSSDRRRILNRETPHDGAVIAIDAGPEVLAARKEAQSIVSSTVMKLRRPDREVLLMHYYAGHTAREVAETLGVSRSAVLKRLERARKNLGNTFEENNVDRTALRDLMVSTSATVMRNVLGATVAWQAAHVAVGTSVWAALASITPKASTVAASFVGMGFAAVVGWSYFAQEGVDEAGASAGPVAEIESAATALSVATAAETPLVASEVDGRAAAAPAQLAQTVDSNTTGASSDEPAESEEPTFLDVNGEWDIVGLLANIEEEEFGRARFIDTGTGLIIEPEDPDMAKFFHRVERTGLDVKMTMADSDAIGTLDGAFNEALTEMVLKGTIQTRADSIPNAGTKTMVMDVTLIATRVTDAVRDRAAAIDALKRLMKELHSKLEDYAAIHGSYPENLKDLIPMYITDTQLVESTSTRELKYTRPMFKSPAHTQLNKFLFEVAVETEPANLMAIEEQLITFWGDRFMESAPLLDVHDSKLETHLWLTMAGSVREAPKTRLSSAELSEPYRQAQSAAQNASCANNMKQLGLSMKMFANEQAGNLYPGGWRMMYNKYLGDTRVLTCPSHSDGTESYELLYPAADNAYLHALARKIEGLGDDGVSAGVLASYVPVVIEKTECSDLNARNVLFMDGHVERIDEDDWDADIGPYLAYR